MILIELLEIPEYITSIPHEDNLGSYVKLSYQNSESPLAIKNWHLQPEQNCDSIEYSLFV